MSGKLKQICFLGSSNTDLTTYTATTPKPGETIRGKDFDTGFGGKGANQCIACGRLGGNALMITMVGADDFGTKTISNFASNGVSTEYVFTTPNAPTGVAQITVTDNGQNAIVIVAGANDKLTPDKVLPLPPLNGDSWCLCCQLEIPIETTIAAMKKAKEKGIKVVLNPAPAPKSFPPELLSECDILIPNETELETLSGMKTGTKEEIIAAATALLHRGPEMVLVTLGEKGCLAVRRDAEPLFVEAKPAAAVDTSGAGDCFIGAALFALSRNTPLREAMAFANAAAGISVCRRGTQKSYPTLKEVEDTMKGTQ